MTEVDISTSNKPEAEKIIVSQQPSLGSLFKSQNGAIWEPSQLEDLKFNLYRAEFTSQTGSFRFYNPNLGVGNRQIASLRANPVVSYAKEVLVGMSGTLTSTDVTNLIPGTSVFQQNYPNFSGKLKSIVGTVGIGSELSITNAGVGYTSDATYTNAPLKTINGNGFGGKVNLTIQGGVAVAATVSIGGTGYAMGDTLTVEPEFTGDFGKNLIISIPNEVGVITAFNSLIVTQVQDELNTSGVSNEIAYVNPSNGISTISNGYVTYTDVLSDGLHFKVNHSNHGMYRDNNKVTLYGIESDVSPVKLTADYNQSSTANIQVSNVGIFTSFENLPVSTDNPGYIKVNREIIKYTSTDTTQNQLGGITRGVDSNVGDVYPSILVGLHPTGTPVYKYEFNGVSLRRINRTHSFSQVDLTKYPIEMDSYHLKLVTNENGKDRLFGPPKLHFFENKTGGTYDGNITATAANTLGGPKATQNVQFNSLRPNLQTLLPESTQVDAKVRTTSGTSVDGQEVSFRSSGFEPISLNSNNLFKSPRIIASRVNEITHLQQSNGYKSFEMEMNLSTTDTKVSPVIDLDRVNIMTTMNRIDKPIDNMLIDNRVNSLFDDPHSAVYVSRIIRLDRGSTGLKVYFDAYRDATNDIRVMYRLLRSDTPDNQELYEFMPGFNNIDSNGNIIDPKDNTGLPDRRVNPSSSESDLSSYEFTSKEVPLFDGFQIKIIMTGTNQAYVPRIKDLRVIATI